ncbi:MAG: helix-hairpin-helix domain-containing protein [Bacteroidales bacterium]|nr:helix-hairpin-helix domain-containing protein [Bacteroidales bacterium]
MNNFLTFTKGERVAIIILAAVIFLLIAANFFMANYPSKVNKNLHDLDSIMALHEAAVDELNARYVAEQLEREARIQKAKVENEKKKYQKLKKAEFKNKDKIAENVVSKKEIEIVNINTADTISFMKLPEIGPFFARNIVAYREKLGGFIDKKQLLEVYRLDSSIFEIIMPYINIDSVSIRKIRINHDDFKTILRHPYIEYEDVKKIVNYRETKGMITNWEQYKKVVTRDDIEERLRLYLEF